MAKNTLIGNTGETGRPSGVALIAIVLIAFGIVTAVLGLLGMLTGFVSGLVNAPRGADGVFIAGVGAVILGAAYVIAGAGLWNLRTWAWWLATLVGIVGFVLAIGSPLGMLIWGGLVAYLFVVRSNFGVLKNVPQIVRA